jgi:hypothetical protein
MGLEAMVVNVTGEQYGGADFPSRTMHCSLAVSTCLRKTKLAHQLPKRSLATARKSEAYSVEPLMRGCGAPALQISFGNGGSLAGPSTVPVGVLTIYLASAMWRKSYRSWGTCPIMITAVPAAKWHCIVNTGPALAKLVSPATRKTRARCDV